MFSFTALVPIRVLRRLSVGTVEGAYVNQVADVLERHPLSYLYARGAGLHVTEQDLLDAVEAAAQRNEHVVTYDELRSDKTVTMTAESEPFADPVQFVRRLCVEPVDVPPLWSALQSSGEHITQLHALMQV